MMKTFTKTLTLSSGLRKLFTLIFILLVAVSGLQGQKYASGKLSLNTADEQRPILFAFGIGLSGRLGTGNENDANRPTAVNNENDWKQVSAGGEYSLAIKKNGTLWAWGSGNSGRLGTGNTEQQNFPVMVGQAANWSQVSAGSSHSLGIRADGTLWAWGNGSAGRLGTGSDNDQYLPTQVGESGDWVQVSAGMFHSIAVKADGTLWAWGSASFGRLGTGDTQDQYRPVQIGNATNWKQVSTAENHSLAIKIDGTLWSWGSGSYGRLGTGNEDSQYEPIQIGEATDWVQVTAGRWHSVALKSDGTLWAWGMGNHLGTGHNENDEYADQYRPVQVGQASDWKHVSAGHDHTLAIKADGTLWSWGHGADGALGMGNIIDQHSPVQIGDQIYTYASAGGFHSLVLRKELLSPDANGIVYVKKGSSGDGSSWGNAAGELSEALLSARIRSDIQQIWVAAGTYKPIYKVGNGSTDRDKAFVLKAGLRLLGGFIGTETNASKRDWKSHATILSGDLDNSGTRSDQDAYHVVIYTGSRRDIPPAVLDGFTITGGNANNPQLRVSGEDGGSISGAYGAGIYSVSSPANLSNLIITGNSAQFAGAGICNSGSSLQLLNVTVSNNKALYGAAVYNDQCLGPINLSNVLISGNSNSSQSGGIIHNERLTVSPTFTNVSIVGNSGIALYNNFSSVTMRNSIVWGNASAMSSLNQSTPNSFSYCLIQGMAADAAGHNLDGNLDPLFLNAPSYTLAPFSGGDYRLKLCSPAINAGNNAYVSDLTVDLDGQNRVFNSITDLGTYEAQNSPNQPGSILYVKQGGTGTGISWDCALGDLQVAINQAGPGNQIWVAQGTYPPTRRVNFVSEITPGNQENAFLLKDGVAIYGGFSGTETLLTERNPSQNETILSGDLGSGVHAYHVVLAIGSVAQPVTSTARLDGFTISGGSASNNGGNILINGHQVNHGNGGGIYNFNASPEYSRIKLTGNHAANNGGAMFNWSATPVLSALTISGNTANYGAGIGNYLSSLEIYSTVISGNAATWGGGISNNGSSPKLLGALLSGNTADFGSAIYNVSSAPILANVTVSGNTNDAVHNTDNTSAPQLKNTLLYGNTNGVSGGNPTYQHSLVQGVTGGSNGNIDGSTDPKFVNPVTPGLSTGGDYRLQLGPAVGMGSNAEFSPELPLAKDLSGASRLVGTKIDLGAYEFQDLVSVLIRYVRSGGSGNGYSWENASGGLQDLINESIPGNQVWVAAGEYQPASGQSFSMKEGVKIYGGFAATGTPAFSDRSWNHHVTILKGNSKSVIANDNNGLTSAAILDGFTITGGSAVTGGGMLNHLAYPLINHCVFKANNASVWGGGIYNDGPGTTTVVNSLFIQNTAQSGGAAFSYQNAKPRFTNVTLAGNTATQNGGALHNYEGAETELVNTIVWGNIQSTTSSQLYTSGPGKTKAYFSVLEGGEQAIIGDKESVQVISLDPLFVDPTNGNFALQGCSPALNIGTGGVLNGFTSDLNGNNRFFDGIVDAGAYEYQAASLTGADRLAVNGYTTSVDISSGQIYDIQATGDACRSVAGISSEGGMPVSGIVHITTHIDNSVQTYNGSPYLQRYYDISPVSDATIATARITLYFTQEEFSAYNTSLGRPALPSGPNESTGSVRIFQYHGSSRPGVAGPAAYQGAPTTITPEVRWHYGLERWEVSFNVKGFSGFFIGSVQAPLPVKLVSFEGLLTEARTVSLQWRVTEQVDMDHYSLEYSNNGKDFKAIGNISANQTTESYYKFTDTQTHLNSIAYYRLRMSELDGSYTYSRIIGVKLPKGPSNILVYPLPAHDFLRIKGKDLTGTSLKLVNTQGVILKLIEVTSDDHKIDVSSLPTGVYFIITNASQTMRFVKN